MGFLSYRSSAIQNELLLVPVICGRDHLGVNYYYAVLMYSLIAPIAVYRYQPKLLSLCVYVPLWRPLHGEYITPLQFPNSSTGLND